MDIIINVIIGLTALYGAVLSTYILLADRGKLNLRCFLGYDTGNPKLMLISIITNAGKKSITVTHLGGIEKNSNKWIMITSFRVIKLEPGDYTTNTCTDFSFLNDNLECIWAIDSLNRKYKLKKKEFNKLIIEAKNTRITEKITPSVLS